MNSQWFLQGEAGDHSPITVPVNKNEYVLGRNSDCDLVLNDQSVSRRHCRIYFRRDELWAVDMGSSNGTWINGVKLDEERPLRNGDLLKMGRLEFQIAEKVQMPDEEKTQIGDSAMDSQTFSDRYGLSVREVEVMYLLLKGVSVKDIAEKLFISPGTAKNHVLRIYKKTQTHSRIELSTLYHQIQV